MTRLWNGRPFKNYWIDLSVAKRSEYFQLADLQNNYKPTTEWEEIETHHQAKLRDILRRDLD